MAITSVMPLLRLPPAVRASIFTRVFASFECKASAAASLNVAGQSNGGRQQRAYATVVAHVQSDLQHAYDLDGDIQLSQVSTAQDVQETSPLQTQQMKRTKLRHRLWNRADQLSFPAESRKWLRQEIKSLERTDGKDELNALRRLLGDHHFAGQVRTRGPGKTDLPPIETPTSISELQQQLKLTPLPHFQQYPELTPKSFRQLLSPSGFKEVCAALARSVIVKERYTESRDETQAVGYACHLTVNVVDTYQATRTAKEATKKKAKRTAWLLLLADLHTSGLLRNILKPNEQPSKLHDLDWIGRHVSVPTKDQYEHAPEQLFDPKFIQNTIHGTCSRLKVAMRAKMDITAKLDTALPTFNCKLKLNLDGLCTESTDGDGMSKQLARNAAWLLMLIRLHENGILSELYPDSGASQEFVNEDGVEVQPITLEKQIMEEEKDAKTEIYEYAAGLGYVPTFDAEPIQLRTTRQLSTAKSMVQVSISLPELDIQASGIGTDLRTAETVAALAFKAKAEEQKATAGGSKPSSPLASVLSIDTAKYFFEFLREVRPRLRISLEHDEATIAKDKRWGAQLSVNGEPLGPQVTMLSKKQAEGVAQLIAAVLLTRQDAELLMDFRNRLIKDKGKILKPISPVKLELDSGALYAMRVSLAEAREHGLPDSHQTLLAEERAREQVPRHGRKQLGEAQVEAISARLVRKQHDFEADPSLRELHSRRAALPMNKYRQQVVEMLTNNAYSIIVGATGSGKTTQVPQIVLEDSIAGSNGGACNIVCTQPRRIAATSVAQRVAAERNEPLQRSVGYHVRFDAKPPQPGGSITYCTTGILLEQLKHDADGILDTISHIVIDEVHERDTNIDFLMIIVKKALTARQAAGRSVPKVILMSATLEIDLFANYFAIQSEGGRMRPCPHISVSGRTFPAKEMFLGSIMHELKQDHRGELDHVLAMDKDTVEYVEAETSYSATNSAHDADVPAENQIDWRRANAVAIGPEEATTVTAEKEEALVPTALTAATIAHICRSSQDGAILTFLPGIEEILRVQRHLYERRIFGLDFTDKTKFKICLLHSTVPKEEQQQIFEPTEGCRKIILSTNIAETSVTIPDVKFVVDTGKLREMRYDQIRRITKLQCVWESKSNSKQRAGRAGRVQDGFYYALFSKERHDSFLGVGRPELLRTDLQETLLSIKAQHFDEPVQDFLAQAIEPPSSIAIASARQALQDIEAFTEDERLTDLGRLLSRLPVHPTLGKMIVLGVIFRCLDPMLILGAAAEERGLFIAPFTGDARASASVARRLYAQGEASDHWATFRAFKDLLLLRDQYGARAALDRAREQWLHFGAFRTIDQTASQIVEVLADSGLFATRGERHPGFYSPPSLNRNSGNLSIVSALLLAGNHPNLAAKATRTGIAYRTASEQGVIMHPSSLNGESKRKDIRHEPGSMFTYSSLNKSADGAALFMRDSTLVSPLMAALFGGRLTVGRWNRLELDWLPLSVEATDRHFATRLILEFRKALDRVLNTAFRSLADVRSGLDDAFANDPTRVQFISRVVDVLDQASGSSYGNQDYKSRTR